MQSQTRIWSQTAVSILVMGSSALSCSNGWTAQLSFAGRTWTIKSSSSPVGPGPNRFSASPNDVWVDQSGLHLTIHKYGSNWYCSEVILQESLGYGTYLFQTTTRQDVLNANAVLGAFTWDPYGDSPIPGDPNREIDFEDSRWGYAADPTNSQAVVQPSTIGNHRKRITIPDLSQDANLTRFFTWSPDQVDFTSALGRHLPNDLPPEDIFHQWAYIANDSYRLVPLPGRETFRFNLWLYQGAPPVGDQPVEVVINDFVFIPLLAGDYSRNGTVGTEDYDLWRASFGQTQVRFAGSDGNGNGLVDAEDYLIWRHNLDNSLGTSASASATAVPEPHGAKLIAFATTWIASCRWPKCWGRKR